MLLANEAIETNSNRKKNSNTLYKHASLELYVVVLGRSPIRLPPGAARRQDNANKNKNQPQASEDRGSDAHRQKQNRPQTSEDGGSDDRRQDPEIAPEPGSLAAGPGIPALGRPSRGSKRWTSEKLSMLQ